MSSSHISGPSIVYGHTTALTNPQLTEIGPSVTNAGDSILDVRFPYTPGKTGVGHVKAFLDSPYVASVDAVPATLSATIIAAAQSATKGTALTLASANAAGVGVNFPIIPANSAVTTANIVLTKALDPGFVSVTLTGTNTAQLTITAANLALFARFKPGLAVLVGVNAGTAWTAARVLTVSGTTITLDTVVTGSSGATAWVALANGQFKLTETPIAASYSLTAGAAAIFDPRSGLARGVSVTTAGANAGGAVTVVGYDIFGFPMSETIACATASTFYGNKAFKYIVSATPTATAAGALTGNVSIGTSDLFGFATRSDAYEYTNVFWAGAFQSSSTGWFAADTTSPATVSTKDVRGAVQVSASGPNGSGIGASTSNGTRRLQIFMSIPQDNLFFATPTDSTSLFGVTQV